MTQERITISFGFRCNRAKINRFKLTYFYKLFKGSPRYKMSHLMQALNQVSTGVMVFELSIAINIAFNRLES